MGKLKLLWNLLQNIKDVWEGVRWIVGQLVGVGATVILMEILGDWQVWAKALVVVGVCAVLAPIPVIVVTYRFEERLKEQFKDQDRRRVAGMLYLDARKADKDNENNPSSDDSGIDFPEIYTASRSG